MTPVTDPQLLAQLNAGQTPVGKPVTDPNILAQLNGSSDQQDPGILDRIGADYNKRTDNMNTGVNASLQGKQTALESGLQGVGQATGFANDVVGEGLKSIAPAVDAVSSAVIPGYPLIKQGEDYVSSAIKNSPVGDLARSALAKYGQFEQNNPRAARNIDALANIGSTAAAFTPVGEQSAAGLATDAVAPIVDNAGSALKTLTAPVHSPIQTFTKAASGLNDVTDAIAGGISNRVNRANLPDDLKSLSNADALFARSLSDEGVTPQQALKDYASAKELGAQPSVAVTSNIPSMQTQAYLTSKGSAGSKVAADAIKEIDNIQIPNLNRQIVNKATGSGVLSAEEYGKRVSSEAKKVFDQKTQMLQTRAKPYYEQSIGLDKSVPIDAPEMKAAMANRKVADALETYRTDPNTLTNVQDDLKKFGIDGGELEKLPYNSTVALHAARTNLREQADAAFRSGETGVFKATKSAIGAIDNAIESAYPSYKYARKIYSKDAGALRALEDSPMAKMASVADGNYSKVSNEIMSKDPNYIKKFMNGLDKSGADPQKMRDSLAGAFLRSQLDNAGNDGRRFSDSVFRNDANKMRLKALVGNQRFDQMAKVDTVIGHLLQTRNIPAQSITSAAQSMKEGVNIPLDKASLISSIRKKIHPSLFEMVQKDPAQAARYNQLLFTDEGYKLLEHLSKGKTTTDADIRNIGKFLNKQTESVKTK